MNVFSRERGFLLSVCLLVLFSSSCITNQGHRHAMASREQRILDLQKERERLKRQLADQTELIDALNVQLSEANSPRIVEVPVPVVQESSFPELDSLGIDYGMRDGALVISIPSSITFASGKASLSSEGRRALNEVAQTLKRQYPEANYFIEGHTDSDPIVKAKFANNRELSLARAMAVLTHLVDECSVSDEQCVAVGHGQYRNLVPNNSASNKARNRRVEIVVRN